MFNIIRSLFICFILLLSVTATAQLAVKREIRKLMKEYDAVGLSVAVVKNNEIIYTKAFGKKSLGQKTKLREKDMFRIASISKSFTATSLMQFVDAGVLSLDADVSDLIGFTVRNSKYPEQKITLQMILSHTSSINDSQGYFTLDVIHPDKNKNAAACYSDNQPGSTYAYCNLNYNIAGTILERISGQRFDQYVVQHILKPLKLYGGYCVDSLDQQLLTPLYDYDSTLRKFTVSENAYNPRREEISNYQHGYSAPVFSPTGGMKISAPDLAVYMIMHMNYGQYRGMQIISEAAARQMQSVIAPTAKYGLALETTSTYIPGKEMKGHTGSAYGLASNMFFSPEEKFGVILITNGSKAQYEKGWHQLLHKAALVLYERLIQ